ncbi:MAG: FKBP-type peptidyl-prolyl cis-trans isomerase FklB [Halioglobus sp.]|jgi:FKBP-type peptidyl-prolyl cis-trans isomerase FklB
MKSIQLLALLLGLAFASCGNKNKSTDTKSTKEVNKKVTPADLGDLYQYYHSNPATLDQKDENIIIEYAANKSITAIRTVSGVYIQTHNEGSGQQVKWGDRISVDYKGYTLDGKEFDSSYDRGEPITFRVGNMNAGWNEALPYLKRGAKATFLIPSHMGYGKKGFPGYIDADTNIAFDVEVLEETVSE